MIQVAKEIFPQPMKSIDAATFTGSFIPVGTPTIDTARIIKFSNLTTVSVDISWDGMEVHDILPTGAPLILDVTANHFGDNQGWFVRKGLQFFVRGIAGTGFFHISLYGDSA